MKDVWKIVPFMLAPVLLGACSMMDQNRDGDNGGAVTADGEPSYKGRNYRNEELMNKAHGRKMNLHVSLGEQKGTLFVGGSTALVFPLSTGIPGHSTPVGRFNLFGKELDHRSSLYGSIYDAQGNKIVQYADSRKHSVPRGGRFSGASMPYTMWFSGSCAFHEGLVPDPPLLTSHGCIHLPPEIARELYALCPVGTPVSISF